MIGAGLGVEARMSLGGHFPDAIDDDVCGKEHVETIGEFHWIGNFTFQIEMRIIVTGMHTGVGPTTSRKADRLSEL